MNTDEQTQMRQIMILSNQIARMLLKADPVVRSAVVADQLAQYLACWPNSYRDTELSKILALASEMVGPYENLILAQAEAANEREC